MVVTADTIIKTLTLAPGEDPNDYTRFEKSDITKGLMPMGGSRLIKEDVASGRKPLNYVLSRFRDPATPPQPVKSEG